MILNQNLLSIDKFDEIINKSKEIPDANIQKLTFELINLKKSFDIIINNSVDGIWEWDLISNKSYISDKLKNILNVDKNIFVGNFLVNENIVHPNCERIYLKVINNSLNDYNQFNCEHKLKCKDGNYQYFSLDGRYIIEENSKKLLVTFKNINEKIKSELEFRLKNYVIENTLTPIVWLNEQGQFVNANNAYLNMLGYTLDELVKLGIEGLDDDYIEQNWVNHWEDIVKNKSVFLITKNKHKDGHYVDIQVNANYVKIDDIELNCAFVQDISKRLKLENEIKESENRFQKLLNDVPNIAIQGYYQNGLIFYWNKASETLYNYSKDEAIGKNVYELLSPPEERDYVINETNIIFETKTTLPARELVVENRFGKKINILATNSLIEQSDGIETLYCFDVDLTEINIAKNKIAFLVEELKEKNSLLEKNINDKDKLFSIIAHDLRSPLSGFMALSKELSENLDIYNMDEIKHFTSTLKNSSENIYYLLENLLQWSQFQENLLKIKKEDVYFNYLLKNNLDILSSKILTKNINIINLAEGPHIFKADLQMINTIIRNLLSNAIKFSHPNGDIEIGVIDNNKNSNQNKDLKLKNSLLKYYNPQYFTFYIKDDGIGIPSFYLKHLGSFTDKIRNGTLNEPSSGLGLVISYDFVNLHNGNIFVETEENKGTTFVVQLPLY